MDNSQNKSLDPNKLPQNEPFIKKKVFKYKRSADTGKPMAADTDKKNEDATGNNLKEEEKSSKIEGLNQQRSAGDAGAFEGFENQQEAV